MGIPYAHPNKRFEPASPATQWSSLFNASMPGPLCWQSQTMLRASVFSASPSEEANPRYAEDCLTVNVYKPTGASHVGTMAVLVWIHGGGFEIGGGSLYDGADLASSQGVVVVTLNYRLGPLGFMVKDASGLGGMNGIHDQIIALQWVRANIASFGGDPSRLTIFGESAGGISVCVLCVSPLARGLFQRAITQSGPCTDSPGWGPKPAAKGLLVASLLASTLGATSLSELSDRTKFPAERLAGWAVSILEPQRSRTDTAPISVDGWVAPASLLELWTNGSAHVSAIVVGANSFDGIVPFSEWAGWLPQNETAWVATLSSRFGAFSARVSAAYPLSNYGGSAVQAFVQVRCVWASDPRT